MGYREQQFRRWVKEHNLSVKNVYWKRLLSDFNAFLWGRARSMSRTPIDVAVNKHALKKWIKRLIVS